LDFVTHSLVGAGVAKLLAPRQNWVPQLSAAALAGSLLQDADSWLYLLGPNVYGKYHRVASHNLWGLALVALASATLAWLLANKSVCRRFGWFVAPNLPREEPVPRAPWLLFLAVAAMSAYLHLAMDMITGFGNVWPFWPWSQWDASLHAVTSFDLLIFSTTFGWHVYMRRDPISRRRQWGATAAYAAVIIVYVAARMAWGEPTVW
jgi:membrane-bound metal-dependent hydrolase YbcI (DUF457 family)